VGTQRRTETKNADLEIGVFGRFVQTKFRSVLVSVSGFGGFFEFVVDLLEDMHQGKRR